MSGTRGREGGGSLLIGERREVSERVGEEVATRTVCGVETEEPGSSSPVGGLGVDLVNSGAYICVLR